ncbi:MAG: hypothetical protein AB1420_07065 [Bacillota bacterium]
MNNESKLEDILLPSEKVIYENILMEIDKHKDFYNNASPEEKTEALIKNCGLNEKELYKLLKKIENFNNT